MPKVLLAGDMNVYSKCLSRARAFERLGAEVATLTHTPLGGEEHGYVEPSFSFRVAWKLGIHPDTESVNSRLLSETARFKPDLIWIEKGNMVRPETLRRLRKISPSAVIAAYSDDDMFASCNRTRAYTAGLRQYDVVFTTKSYNTDPEELPRLGAKRVVMVDKAYDPNQHKPLELSTREHKELGCDVGFIGSFAPERLDAVKRLAVGGIAVRVWGNGWEGVPEGTPNLILERRALVNGLDDLKYTKGICATRINLGFLRKANRDLQTDRSIEIPACRGFMLAEMSNEHARLFEDGREAVFFTSHDDLTVKARYFLEHEDERAEIAAAGRRRCVESGYTHQDRVGFMLSAALDGQP